MIMTAKLISYTRDPNSDKSLQDLVCYCARVSNPANQNNTETNESLIQYLLKNNHWSPLEMVNICLEIETTRDIARQILRHRSFSFQEFSQRYAVAELGFEFREMRMQDTKNRQNSLKVENSVLQDQWGKAQKLVADHAENIQLRSGNGTQKEHREVALECAKAIEPIFPMIMKFVV